MPTLSICMVSLDCLRVIEPCLVSLANSAFRDFEIIIADNGSVDGTLEYLRARDDIHLIENGSNVGFTKGTNRCIAASSGEYILWLNTDTVIAEDSLGNLVEFLRSHPSAGVVGPKVLNADGSFQSQCRRGLPTPLASLSYIFGIDRIWPHRPAVSQYLLRSLPEDESNIVTAVSGCCLMTRRETVEQVGPLDEEMFAFGEDLDWCVRAQKMGWEVWYYPGSVITHLKGAGGAHSKPYRKIRAMHGCMWLFYKKHLRPRYLPPVTALVALGISTSFVAQIAAAWARRAVRLTS